MNACVLIAFFVASVPLGLTADIMMPLWPDPAEHPWCGCGAGQKMAASQWGAEVVAAGSRQDIADTLP